MTKPEDYTLTHDEHLWTSTELEEAKQDFFAMLTAVPDEILLLREALTIGELDGRFYMDVCCCFIGTVAKARDCSVHAIPGLKPDSSRPAERLGMLVRQDSTPENNVVSKFFVDAIDEFLAKQPTE